MKIKCDYCGKVFNRQPSHIKEKNYCCKECRHKAKNVVLKCETCGKTFERLLAEGIHKHNFCCKECAKPYLSLKFTAYNGEHNPTAMTEERKTKIRQKHLGKGSGKTYTKTYGRHTHRIVAEHMLGRSLKVGEVVHHIDGNKRNNSPSNLMIFATQAEHAKWHYEHDKILNPKKIR